MSARARARVCVAAAGYSAALTQQGPLLGKARASAPQRRPPASATHAYLSSVPPLRRPLATSASNAVSQNVVPAWMLSAR